MSTVYVSRTRQVSIPLAIPSADTCGLASAAAALLAADTPYLDEVFNVEPYGGTFPDPQIQFNSPTPQSRGIVLTNASGQVIPFNLNAASQLLDFGVLVRRRQYDEEKGIYSVPPVGTVPQVINYFPLSQNLLEKIIPSIQLGVLASAPEISGGAAQSNVSLNVSRAITLGVSLPFSISAVYACNSPVFNNRTAIESILGTNLLEQHSVSPYQDLNDQLVPDSSASEGLFLSLDANFVETYAVSIDPRILDNAVNASRDIYVSVPFSCGNTDLPVYSNASGNVPLTSAARSRRLNSNGGSGALLRYVVPVSYLKQNNFSNVADYNYAWWPSSDDFGVGPSANVFYGSGTLASFPSAFSSNVRVSLEPITSSAITEINYGDFNPDYWGPVY